ARTIDLVELEAHLADTKPEQAATPEPEQTDDRPQASTATQTPSVANDALGTVAVHPDSFAGARAAMFPTVAEDMVTSPAFGSLSKTVNRLCREKGVSARQVLESISEDDRALAVEHSVDAALF